MTAHSPATPPAREQPDVERLAKAAYEAFVGRPSIGKVHEWERCGEAQADVFRSEAHAILAALTAQRFVVVRREDLATVLGIRELVGPMDRHERDAINRLRAALAAAQDEPGPGEKGREEG